MKDADKLKKKRLMKKFFITLFLGIVIFFIAFLLVTIGLIYLNNKTNFLKLKENSIEENKYNNNEDKLLKIVTKIPQKTNFLIIGLDEKDIRSDTLMVASFDSKKQEVNIISIPRDTYITMPENRVKLLKYKYNRKMIPDNGKMKINEIHSYAGKKRGVEFLKLQVEELLGININYYIKINLKGFVYIVDKIGGIEFNVPRRMYYKDPTQNLLINLKPGLQILNGKNAEGLVRFRRYIDGDIDRIKIQQDFIKAAAEQILNKYNIKNNIINFLITLIRYVDTDFKLEDITKYAKYIDDIKQENLHMYIMPHTPKYVDNISYVFVNEKEKKELVEEIFYDKKIVKIENSKNKRIKILNSEKNNKKAKEVKNLLEKENFKIESIENYNGEKFKEIRIFVKKYGYGEDIKKLLENSILIKDENITKNYDIVIII